MHIHAAHQRKIEPERKKAMNNIHQLRGAAAAEGEDMETAFKLRRRRAHFRCAYEPRCPQLRGGGPVSHGVGPCEIGLFRAVSDERRHSPAHRRDAPGGRSARGYPPCAYCRGDEEIGRSGRLRLFIGKEGPAMRHTEASRAACHPGGFGLPFPYPSGPDTHRALGIAGNNRSSVRAGLCSFYGYYWSCRRLYRRDRLDGLRVRANENGPQRITCRPDSGTHLVTVAFRCRLHREFHRRLGSNLTLIVHGRQPGLLHGIRTGAPAYRSRFDPEWWLQAKPDADAGQSLYLVRIVTALPLRG